METCNSCDKGASFCSVTHSGRASSLQIWSCVCIYDSLSFFVVLFIISCFKFHVNPDSGSLSFIILFDFNLTVNLPSHNSLWSISDVSFWTQKILQDLKYSHFFGLVSCKRIRQDGLHYCIFGTHIDQLHLRILRKWGSGSCLFQGGNGTGDWNGVMHLSVNLLYSNAHLKKRTCNEYIYSRLFLF